MKLHNFILIGMILPMTISSDLFAVTPYDKAKDMGYDWLEKEQYQTYVAGWSKFTKKDPQFAPWESNTVGFSLNDKDGYKKVFQFREPDAIGNDHWVFFALPKKVKDNDFKDIYVYAENDRNVCHFSANGNVGNYKYSCPSDSLLCYISVVTKGAGDPHNPFDGCFRGTFKASSVYLRVDPEYFIKRLAPTGGGLKCVGPICWTPTNVTCLNADSWYQFIDDEPVQKTIAICNDINKVSGGTSTPPTEPPASGKLPDFITSKVTLGNKDGNHEKMRNTHGRSTRPPTFTHGLTI